MPTLLLLALIYLVAGYLLLAPHRPRLPRDDGHYKPWVGEVYKTIFGGRSYRNDWEARFATREQALKYTRRAARYIDRITPTQYRTEDGWEKHEFGIEWCVYCELPPDTDDEATPTPVAIEGEPAPGAG